MTQLIRLDYGFFRAFMQISNCTEYDDIQNKVCQKIKRTHAEFLFNSFQLPVGHLLFSQIHFFASVVINNPANRRIRAVISFLVARRTLVSLKIR